MVKKFKSIEEAFASLEEEITDEEVDLYEQEVIARNKQIWPVWTLEQKLDLCDKTLEKIESSIGWPEGYKTLNTLYVYEYRGNLSVTQ